jgi:hypothetical protein
MLLQIRDYLRREKVASNQQLAREFKIELSALDPMLTIWLNKGIIIRCQEKPACQSSCFKCKAQPPIYYTYAPQIQKNNQPD